MPEINPGYQGHAHGREADTDKLAWWASFEGQRERYVRLIDEERENRERILAARKPLQVTICNAFGKSIERERQALDRLLELQLKRDRVNTLHEATIEARLIRERDRAPVVAKPN